MYVTDRIGEYPNIKITLADQLKKKSFWEKQRVSRCVCVCCLGFVLNRARIKDVTARVRQSICRFRPPENKNKRIRKPWSRQIWLEDEVMETLLVVCMNTVIEKWFNYIKSSSRYSLGGTLVCKNKNIILTATLFQIIENWEKDLDVCWKN